MDRDACLMARDIIAGKVVPRGVCTRLFLYEQHLLLFGERSGNRRGPSKLACRRWRANASVPDTYGCETVQQQRLSRSLRRRLMMRRNSRSIRCRAGIGYNRWQKRQGLCLL